MLFFSFFKMLSLQHHSESSKDTEKSSSRSSNLLAAPGTKIRKSKYPCSIYAKIKIKVKYLIQFIPLNLMYIIQYNAV